MGAAVARMGGVKTVADMRNELTNAEWLVGRAYSLLQEVRAVMFFPAVLVGLVAP